MKRKVRRKDKWDRQVVTGRRGDERRKVDSKSVPFGNGNITANNNLL